MVVILNEVKNLMISTESTIEILRLSPQNDITTPSPEKEWQQTVTKVYSYDETLCSVGLAP
jgi:hypothetical protein